VAFASRAPSREFARDERSSVWKGGPRLVRNKRLDILRCIAVLMVLLCHAQVHSLLKQTGWAGVDLFFVLSGFLISGLLFTEYKKRGAIDFKRFFIRRGLKIYRAFYTLILVSAVMGFALRNPAPLAKYLREIFFVQNYNNGMWPHTWSLAIEEHFYILLPILVILLIRYSSDRADPFRSIPWVFAVLAVLSLAVRAATIYLTPPSAFEWGMVMNPTHERMDSLFFGVFLGYLQHFRPRVLEQLLRPVRNRVALGFLTAALLSCCIFFTRESHFLLTFGFTFLYLGFGGLMLLSLTVRDILPERVALPLGVVGDGLAFVGM
jgi:peptidoglycan/LPS O-acetylase OafA/YrhL